MNIARRIAELKKKHNAVILAHNYQVPEVQDIADYVGDSLGLSVQASETQAELIVFCGVYFMAETAKILCPRSTVILPDVNAGCPMADMIDAEELKTLKASHPDAKVMCYVNSTAEVKAECDICCTSANAEMIAEKMFEEAEEVIFVPDKYLAHFVSSRLGRNFITWEGYCPSHMKILPEDIRKQRENHPNAPVIVHPECTPAVIAAADEALSTEGMCRFAAVSGADEIIVGTEIGLLHRLQKENPGKKFYPASKQCVCPNMKRITLEKVLWSLEELQHRIVVPDEIASRAGKCIKRMMDMRDN